MNPPGAVARDLWTRTGDDSSAPEAAVESAARVCAQLREGLARWIGSHGTDALLVRAFESVRPHHPALSCFEIDKDTLVPAVAAKVHGAADVGAGMVALVSELIELLGRIIGDEMAVRLVEQVCVPGPRLVVNNERKRSHHG